MKGYRNCSSNIRSLYHLRTHPRSFWGMWEFLGFDVWFSEQNSTPSSVFSGYFKNTFTNWYIINTPSISNKRIGTNVL